MKNHYIPQFIIKKFSKAINVFYFETKELRENRPSEKVFFEKDIYDDEVEKSLNINLESTFSNLVTDKLLKEKDDIILTRKELLLVKKYMLVSSIRAQGKEHFRDYLISFKKKTNNFFKYNQSFRNTSLPFTEETTLSDRELFNNAILAFSQAKYIADLANNPLCTREMVAYAAPFLLSYITFWDAPDDNEFILSDIGMVSEYEGIHQITGGLALSKLSYLFHQIYSDDKRKAIYGDLFSINEVMYENYDIFNISKKRCLIMISPFFRQYFEMNCCLFDKENTELIKLPQPYIWPAIIQNKNLFVPPKNEYMINPYIQTEEDLYIYESKKLTQEELIYINSMLITQSKKLIGFDSGKNVFPSIEFVIDQKCWFGSVTADSNMNNQKMFCNFVTNLSKEPLQNLALWCEQNNDVIYLDISKLFDDYMSNIYRDFKSNIYIYEYLLINRENTYNCKELDFLGKGNREEKMKVIEREYKRIKENLEHAK